MRETSGKDDNIVYRKGAATFDFRWWDYTDNDIRRAFYSQIKQVMNGGPMWLYGETHLQKFIHQCETVKNRLSVLKNRYEWSGESFAWLDLAETRQVIRGWQGEWLDLIPYLIRHGLIEKAVRKQIKIWRTK
jgi:hypothetical protein